jgi:lysozyme
MNENLSPSQRCIALVKSSEGFIPKAKWDVNGWAIGYGHHGAEVNASLEISLAQGDEILKSDLEKFSKEIKELVKVPLTQGEFDALVDFTYELGAGRLRYSTMLKLINQEKYIEAGNELIKWVIVEGKSCNALKARRKAEFELWNSIRSTN